MDGKTLQKKFAAMIEVDEKVVTCQIQSYTMLY